MATVEEIKIIVKAETDAAIAKLTQLGKTTKENNSTFAKMRDVMQGPIAAFNMIGRPIMDTVSNMVKLAAAQERVKMEFSVLTQSMEVGNKLFDQMNQLAAETPLALNDITSAGKQLLAVGIPVEEITGKLRMLGDVAMGNPAKLDRLTMAFGQLKSKGVASMEQLNRFIEAGVPIMAELEKQTGKTGAEVFKMVSQGEIGFKDVELALKNMTSEGGLYNDMMKQVAGTAEGLFSTAVDATKMLMVEMGNTVLPNATGALRLYIAAMEDLIAQEKIWGGLKNAEKAAATIASIATMVAKGQADILKDSVNDVNLDVLRDAYRQAVMENPLATTQQAAALKTLEKLIETRVREEAAIKNAADAEAAAAAKKAAAIDHEAEARIAALKVTQDGIDDITRREYNQLITREQASDEVLALYRAEQEALFAAGYTIDRVGTIGGKRMNELAYYLGYESGGVAQGFVMAREEAEELKEVLSEVTIGEYNNFPETLEDSIIRMGRLGDLSEVVIGEMNNFPETLEDSLKRLGDLSEVTIGEYNNFPEPFAVKEWIKETGLLTEEEAAYLDKVKATNDAIQAKTNLQNKYTEAAVLGFASMGGAIGEAMVAGEGLGEAMKDAFKEAVASMIEMKAKLWTLEAIAAFASGNIAGGIGYTAAATAGYAGATVVRAMADGGSGMVTKPTLFLAGEAGPESFAFGGANDKRGMPGGGNVTYIYAPSINGSILAQREVERIGVQGMAKMARGY